MGRHIGRKVELVGYHIPDGGLVFKYRLGTKGVSWLKCEVCGRTTSAGGALQMRDITQDITKVYQALTLEKAINYDAPSTKAFMDVLTKFADTFDQIAEEPSKQMTLHGVLGAYNTALETIVTALKYDPPATFTATEDATEAEVVLEWATVTDNTADGASPIWGYYIYRSEVDETGPFELAYKIEGQDEVAFTDDQVISGEEYWYSIVTVNELGIKGDMFAPVRDATIA
jgi:hypothetical protein